MYWKQQQQQKEMLKGRLEHMCSYQGTVDVYERMIMVCIRSIRCVISMIPCSRLQMDISVVQFIIATKLTRK